MPSRLTEVGAHERPDHYFLPDDAKCFFWGEYTPFEHTNGKKWNFSATNQLISNFKKKLDKAGQYEWRYKQEAIRLVARSFAQFWRWDNLHQQHRVALIPIPPSKARTDPMFDPRMLQMLTTMVGCVGIQLDIRDCLSFSGKYAASHESDDRPTPGELYDELSFSDVEGKPGEPPDIIFLFDDMLTTGAHYIAATRRLAEVFPGVPVLANFIARRVVRNPFIDLSDFDEL